MELPGGATPLVKREFAGYTRYRHGEYWLPENDRGRSAGSAFEPERSRGTLGATPARSVP